MFALSGCGSTATGDGDTNDEAGDDADGGGSGGQPKFEPELAVESPTPEEAALFSNPVTMQPVASYVWDVLAMPLGVLADGRLVRMGNAGQGGGFSGLLTVDETGAFKAGVFQDVYSVTFTAFSPDRTTLWTAYTSASDQSTMQIRTASSSDFGDTWNAPILPLHSTVPIPVDSSTWSIRLPEALGVRQRLAVTDTGRLCLTDTKEVHCLMPGESSWTHPLDTSSFERLGLTQEATEAFEALLGHPPTGISARVRALTPIPGDRVGVLLSVFPLDGSTEEHKVEDVWLLSMNQDSTEALMVETTHPVRPAIGLEPDTANFHRLQGCEALVWIGEYGALAAMCRAQDHSWEDPEFSSAYALGLPAADPQRYTGFALRMVTVDDPGYGEVPLTEAWLRRAHCDTWGLDYFGCRYGGTPHPWTNADGSFELLALQEPEDAVPYYRFDRLAVNIDTSAMDFDLDTLTTEVELARGTHPFRADSDFGGDDDGDEVRGGSNPLDASDDTVPGPYVTWSEDPEWGADLGINHGAGVYDQDFLIGSAAAKGPICSNGRCVDETGSEVSSWEPMLDQAIVSVRKTLDGRSIAFGIDDDAYAIRLVDTEGGEQREVLPRAALDEVMARESTNGIPLSGWQNLELIAVSEDEFWVVQYQYPARIAVFNAAGDARIVYHGEEWRCSAKLGPCDQGPFPIGPNIITYTGSNLPFPPNGPPDLPPPLVYDVNPEFFYVWGYEPTTERLLVVVFGTWQTYLLGLHAEKPAERYGGLRDTIVRLNATFDPLLEKEAPVLDRRRIVISDSLRLDETGLLTPQGRPLPGDAPPEVPYVNGLDGRLASWRYVNDGTGIDLVEIKPVIAD